MRLSVRRACSLRSSIKSFKPFNRFPLITLRYMRLTNGASFKLFGPAKREWFGVQRFNVYD